MLTLHKLSHATTHKRWSVFYLYRCGNSDSEEPSAFSRSHMKEMTPGFQTQVWAPPNPASSPASLRFPPSSADCRQNDRSSLKTLTCWGANNMAHNFPQKKRKLLLWFFLLHKITFFPTTMILKVNICRKIIWKIISTSSSSNIAILHAVLSNQLSEYEDNIASKYITRTLFRNHWELP